MRRVVIDGRPWLVDDKSAEAMLADGRATEPGAESKPAKKATRKRAARKKA